jgi:thiamine monophosphate kinase
LVKNAGDDCDVLLEKPNTELVATSDVAWSAGTPASHPIRRG